MLRQSRLSIVVGALISISVCLGHAADFKFKDVTITVPDGFTVEVAAEAPLVGHPMMACFDEKGRMFISEAAGTNAVIEILENITPNFVRMIEDTDGDGKFDKSTIFADKLQIPNGALWHNGSLYVAEPPGIWRYTDTNNDGVADVREHVAGRVKSNGMSASLHGPVLGPTGRLFWCGGQSGYSLDKDQPMPDHRITPGVFTLKTNGSEHERWSVGGFANPVEVCFSEEGEVFGTVAIHDREDGARHDSLMHWVYGGVYNVNPNDWLLLKETGPHLPPLSRVGQVAPAGVMRYRGEQFGGEYRDNIFWAQFNTHKIVRTQIKRKGATFESKDEDFFIGDNVDFHVTDVFEDADGSLLVIDTGGWFRHGCPTSQLAKPDVQGAIYRIRKTGAKKIEDPRGLTLEWTKVSPAELCQRLNDARFVVADRAIAELAQRGSSSVSALHKTVRSSESVQARRNAIWALSRIGTESAHAAIRVALDDKDGSVRQSAVYACGMERDGLALQALLRLVVADMPSIRREAATALGRIKNVKAVPRLLEALRAKGDAFLTHSLIYALIEINNVDATQKGLADTDPRVRRGALLALNKMDNVQLSREQIAPLLRSDDLDLQKASFSIAVKNTNFADELVAVMRESFAAPSPSDDKLALLSTTVVGLSSNAPAQQLVAETLVGDSIAKPVRLMLLDTMKRPKNFPNAWLDALSKNLQHEDRDVRMAALSVVQERGNRKFDDLLTKMAADEKQPPAFRMAVLNALAPRLSGVSAESFSFLDQTLQSGTPVLRLSAARTLAALKLSDEQLIPTAAKLPTIDPLVLPTLLRAFARNTNEPVGLALVSGLDKTPAAANLSTDELARMLQKYSYPVQQAAKPLLQKLGADLEKQQANLEELMKSIDGGDFSRGKAVFFGKKAACFNCHRVSGQGGVVGPNLSQIGKIRNSRDLLESVLYPSASIVQGYHPFNIDTQDDQVYTGVITQQTDEAVWIRGTDLVENKVEQKRIKNMRESATSIMPAGFGDVLTKEELRDLIAFLTALK